MFLGQKYSEDSRPDLLLPQALKEKEANFRYEDEKPTAAVVRAVPLSKFVFLFGWT